MERVEGISALMDQFPFISPCRREKSGQDLGSGLGIQESRNDLGPSLVLRTRRLAATRRRRSSRRSPATFTKTTPAASWRQFSPSQGSSKPQHTQTAPAPLVTSSAAEPKQATANPPKARNYLHPESGFRKILRLLWPEEGFVDQNIGCWVAA